MKRSTNLFILLSLTCVSAFADRPPFTAECSSSNPGEKKFTLHFDAKDKSVFEPKEKEPIWIDYNENVGKFTVCQQKSQYVPLFLGRLIELLKKTNFKKESLSLGNMRIDPLSNPFVCVSYSKKGYEYVGAFVLEQDRNRFPSPNDNKYGLIYLPLTGKSPDGLLGKPGIATRTESIQSFSSKHFNRPLRKTSLLAKTTTFECRSLGGGDASEAPSLQSPQNDLEDKIEVPILSE